MTQLTCLACRVIFDDADAQRTHYKTDWHRYNLKRKIAELPPVTFGEFNRIVQFHTEKREEKLQEKVLACQACSKSFSSDNAYENHLKSKKHKEQSSKSSTEDSKKKISSKKKQGSKVKPKAGYMPPLESYEVDDGDSDEWEDVDEEEIEEVEECDEEEISEALPPMFCLFCPHESVNIEDNFRHMTKSHSFFIPDFKYVVDLEGFFIYLGAKVGDGKVCLKCNNHSRQFQSTRACQMHMTDKGHCMLDTEGDAMLEYSDFYDFSASYPDHDGEVDADDELSAGMSGMNVDDSTLELILPSGARAGHRALNRYYKQNISPEETRQKNRRLIVGYDNQVRSLGLSNTVLNVAVRKKIIHARKVENRMRLHHSMRLGIKANKLQKHFRDQNEGGG
jgi:pre-60S factor REI1